MRLSFLLLAVMAINSCKTTGLFKKESPHERFTESLKEAGLDASALGIAWQTAASAALASPLSLTLPYQEKGFFDQARPSAAGYRFSLLQGQKASVAINKRSEGTAMLFADLFDAVSKKRIAFADSSLQLEVEADERMDLVLRVQPELLKSIEYTLVIKVLPSLAFPVPGKQRGKIGSFWGAARDGGARSHEGIDIFAAKRTPTVAVADGRVQRVQENRLGGKVVFFRPKDKNLSVYYAHLDEQLVSAGQNLKAGDTIGLIGNTGNARTTPPHLHFGIYTAAGAVDPLPFVNPDVKPVPPIKAEANAINTTVRTAKRTEASTPNGDLPLEKHCPVKILAAYNDQYRVLLPDGTLASLKATELEELSSLGRLSAKAGTMLLEKPAAAALVVATLQNNEPVQEVGYFSGFSMVRQGEQLRWVYQATAKRSK